MDQAAILACVAFAAILVALIVVRTRNASFEIKPTDLAVAILPVFLYLLAAGKIKQFEFGGVRVETAVIEAAHAQIAPQIAAVKGITAEPLRAGTKGGMGEIPRLRGQQVEALRFTLGRAGYAGYAIQEYVRQLGADPSFRWLVIEDGEGRFHGLVAARPLAGSGSAYWDDFAEALRSGDAEWIARNMQPLTAANAVADGSDKREVLRRMDGADIEQLPVVDAAGKLVGMVDRSRVAASLILDVADRLSDAKG